MTITEQLKGMSDVERRTFLESNAESIHEDMSYIYQFSEEEIEAMQRDFVEVNLQLRKLDKEKAEMLADFKERYKTPKSRSSELLDHLTDGFERREGLVFVLHDYDARRIYNVNEFGQVISERPLVDKDRPRLQTSLLSVKTA